MKATEQGIYVHFRWIDVSWVMGGCCKRLDGISWVTSDLSFPFHLGDDLRVLRPFYVICSVVHVLAGGWCIALQLFFFVCCSFLSLVFQPDPTGVDDVLLM